MEKLNNALAEMSEPTLYYDVRNRGSPQLIWNIVWHCVKLTVIIFPLNLLVVLSFRSLSAMATYDICRAPA